MRYQNTTVREVEARGESVLLKYGYYSSYAVIFSDRQDYVSPGWRFDRAASRGGYDPTEWWVVADQNYGPAFDPLVLPVGLLVNVP